jgi:hypothetical protein
MEKVKVAFEFCEDWTPEQIRQGLAHKDFVGYQEISCHMVFEVKMDLTRKAQFVAGSHLTETPSSLTYSSVVSRDSVRIAFLMAALHDFDIMSCDMGNACLPKCTLSRKDLVCGGTRIRITSGTSYQDCTCTLRV